MFVREKFHRKLAPPKKVLLICIVGSGADNPKCVTFAPTYGR